MNKIVKYNGDSYLIVDEQIRLGDTIYIHDNRNLPSEHSICDMVRVCNNITNYAGEEHYSFFVDSETVGKGHCSKEYPKSMSKKAFLISEPIVPEYMSSHYDETTNTYTVQVKYKKLYNWIVPTAEDARFLVALYDECIERNKMGINEFRYVYQAVLRIVGTTTNPWSVIYRED